MNLKVTPAQVKIIRSARKRGESLRAIAAKVGLSHEAVRNILTRLRTARE